MNSELLGLAVGLLLTLFVFSYLLGDNWLYRVAVHIMVGVSAAYATVIAIEELFVPVFSRLLAEPTSLGNLLWLIPLALSVLLLLNWLRPVAWLANSSVALLVGTGAAVALVGVITGTVLPQILSAPGEGIFEQVLVALLTISTLLYFQFTRPDNEERSVNVLVQQTFGRLGHALLMITFGALFAGAFTTSLVLLTDRLSYLVGGVLELMDIFLP
jgi:hypothetical protein